MTTLADPGAIDLDDFQEIVALACEGLDLDRLEHLHVDTADVMVALSLGRLESIIAAVEALRDRAADLESEISRIQGLYTKGWYDKAITAEARVAELAGALEVVMKDYTGAYESAEIARAVLNASPAKALERARAVEEVLKWARQLIAETAWIPTEECDLDGAGPGNELVSALTKLGTLGKESG